MTDSGECAVAVADRKNYQHINFEKRSNYHEHIKGKKLTF